MELMIILIILTILLLVLMLVLLAYYSRGWAYPKETEIRDGDSGRLSDTGGRRLHLRVVYLERRVTELEKEIEELKKKLQ